MLTSTSILTNGHKFWHTILIYWKRYEGQFLELTNYICKYANKCNLSTEFCWIETKQLHLHKLIITLLNLIALNMQVKTYKHGNTTFIS